MFHDNLITRLKVLSSIQTTFETKVKEIEGKYGEKIGELKRCVCRPRISYCNLGNADAPTNRQLESRWRQLDKFEASLKQLGDVKRDWRKKLREKEGENEGLKVGFSFALFCQIPLSDTIVIIGNQYRSHLPTVHPQAEPCDLSSFARDQVFANEGSEC